MLSWLETGLRLTLGWSPLLRNCFLSGLFHDERPLLGTSPAACHSTNQGHYQVAVGARPLLNYMNFPTQRASWLDYLISPNSSLISSFSPAVCCDPDKVTAQFFIHSGPSPGGRGEGGIGPTSSHIHYPGHISADTLVIDPSCMGRRDCVGKQTERLWRTDTSHERRRVGAALLIN